MSSVVGRQTPDFIEGWINDYFERPIPLEPKRLGFGQVPALLLIDFQKSKRPGKSELVDRAVANTSILLKEAREKKVPVFYTAIAYRPDLKDFIPNKMQPRRIIGTDDEEIVEELKPREGEVLIIKQGNSAFMGTNLLTLLNLQGIDTLIITGCHTSGCIRATASDSFSLGIKTVLPEECVGDSKGWKPHKANLCDLHARGADVITLAEVIDYLRSMDDAGAPSARVPRQGKID